MKDADIRALFARLTAAELAEIRQFLGLPVRPTLPATAPVESPPP